MDLWQRIFEREMVPSGGFGSIIKKSGVEKNKWLQGAGSCIFLPVWNKEHENTLTIPAGEYVCMYMQWLAKNNYELAGDIIDVCLLDTTFYKQETGVDFCMLQAPVTLKK